MSASTSPALGFVGTGTITSAIVTGLCTRGDFDTPIFVSPRNAGVAHDLAQQFPNVTIAGSNQDVVDCAGMVLLAVRPQIADEVLRALSFRPDQRIVSLIATFSRVSVASRVAPATLVTCAVPQPTVADRAGPTVQFPPDPVAASLFARLGPVFEVESEDAFRKLFAVTAAMAAYFAWLDALASWLVAQGIDAATARDYIAGMFKGLGGVAPASTAAFDALAQAFRTRGGLNEQFARHLADQGVFDACATGLDAILERLRNGTS